MDYVFEFRDKTAAFFVHDRVRSAYRARQMSHQGKVSVDNRTLGVSEEAFSLAESLAERTGAKYSVTRIARK
ncbi:MAG: hypothetical protein ACP5NS_00945 [Candidatus Pacearchaeota archaeon]